MYLLRDIIRFCYTIGRIAVRPDTNWDDFTVYAINVTQASLSYGRLNTLSHYASFAQQQHCLSMPGGKIEIVDGDDDERIGFFNVALQLIRPASDGEYRARS